jgi:hypothetical protein
VQVRRQDPLGVVSHPAKSTSVASVSYRCSNPMAPEGARNRYRLDTR